MKNLQNRDQFIAYLAAEGKKNSEIAIAVGLSADTVRLKLTDERIQFEIKHLRYKLHGKDHKKRFQEILPYAIDATEQILKDPNAKAAVKLAAAQEVMDRYLGKPKQTLEVEGSMVRALLERMDQPKEVPPIDVKRRGKELAVIDADSSPQDAKIEETQDPVEQWVSKNL